MNSRIAYSACVIMCVWIVYIVGLAMLILGFMMVRGSVVWVGKPWIVPSVLARTVFIGVIAVAAVVAEFMFGIADNTIADKFPSVPVVGGWSLLLWTGLVFFLAWALSMVHLVLLRASHTYVLHDDSLEIRTGILSTMAFEVSPSGFSDLVVFRSLVGRLTDSGDIIIQTQTERASVKRMVRVRHPMRVGDQIREVMSRPIVRIEGSEDKK